MFAGSNDKVRHDKKYYRHSVIHRNDDTGFYPYVYFHYLNN
jgi:hypothetical protein